MLVVDFHIHPTKDIVPWVYDWIEGFLPEGEDPRRYLEEVLTKEGILRFLDDNGLDYAVALAELNPRCSGTITNDELADFCRDIDRLIPFADVNPHMTADPAKELERCVRDMGFRGVKLYPVYQLFYANDHFLYPLYEKAQELGVPVMVHTGPGLPFADPALLIARARAFPEVTVVLAHAGAAIVTGNAIAAAEVCDNIMLETSWCRPGDIAVMIARVGADRVMFGTDAPNNVTAEIAKYDALDLTPTVRAAVLGGTATRVFGLS